MTARVLRYGIGMAISVAAIIITLSRVDVADVADAVVSANPGPVLLAVILVAAEVLVRAVRWQVLMRPMRALPFPVALGYLCIGYFANSVLPARLGDLTRAYLAGTAFGVRRTSTFGTILVERVSDGLLMLVVVVLVGSLVPGGGNLVLPALTLAAIGVGALILVVVSLAGVRRSRVASTRGWALIERFLERLLEGTRALRQPGWLLAQLGLTVVAFAIAVGALLAVGRSVGLTLSLADGALVSAGLALSLALPAGPAFIGTYELVGLTILSALGMPAGPALATIVVHHAVVAIPPALAGILAMWLLHVRVASLPSQGEEALAVDEGGPKPVITADSAEGGARR